MKDKVIFGMKVLFLVLIVVWIGAVITDYFNARNGNDPKFCLKEVVHLYDASGNPLDTLSIKDFEQNSDSQKENMLYTYECLGFGYKVYQYHREFSAVEFGPFFIPERQSVD